MNVRETNTNGLIVNVDHYNALSLYAEELVQMCHALAKFNNWWDKERNVGEMLCLIHSEISEAMEGYRKDKMDEHLPHHKSITVELADALIRICDLAGGLELPLATAFAEKLCFNQERADHKISHRMATGGKKF